MPATSTARVVKFQARQKAGLIILQVAVDEAALVAALNDAGLPSMTRADLADAAADIIRKAIAEQQRKPK